MKHRFVFPALILFALLSLNLADAQSALNDGTEAPKSTGNCSQKNTGPALPTRAAPDPRLLTADPYQIAFKYLVTFYPRWFTWEQASGGPCNVLIGPDHISPLYKAVVAINDDTLYASTFLGAEDEPVIVTIPATNGIYSVLHLDQYGALVPNGLSGTNTAGVYGIVGPNWVGTLPTGITRVDVPYNYTELLFRADKYSPSGQDMRAEADKFRRNVSALALSDYLNNPNNGKTQIRPESNFASPVKTVADVLISVDAIEFLRQTQAAVASPTTQPLSASEQTLSDTFDALFSQVSKHPLLAAGARAGHQALINNYRSNRIPGSSWITFGDIAEWDLSSFQGYLNRASITEYIQYGNNHEAAAYFHSFRDADGQLLDGSLHGYALTFAQGQQPETKRFWSLTAYIPQAIELVPNQANKYVVASYTPGLVTAQDGSVTIIMSTMSPVDPAQQANWLPIPAGKFNVMLRDYGPEGSVENGTYVPPPITVH